MPKTIELELTSGEARRLLELLGECDALPEGTVGDLTQERLLAMIFDAAVLHNRGRVSASAPEMPAVAATMLVTADDAAVALVDGFATKWRLSEAQVLRTILMDGFVGVEEVLDTFRGGHGTPRRQGSA
jgi:hypothetical protein